MAITIPRQSRNRLRLAALLFLGGFLLHNADHFRRGLQVLTPEVLRAGTISGAVALVAIGMTLFKHPLAPAAALALGFSVAIGVSIVHLLPRWSALSDSLPDGNADPLTWVAVLCKIGGALVFGLGRLDRVSASSRWALVRNEGLAAFDRALQRPSGGVIKRAIQVGFYSDRVSIRCAPPAAAYLTIDHDRVGPDARLTS